MKPQTSNRIAWVLRVLLALTFLGSGWGKLSGNQQVSAAFAHWGYPGWFMVLTGICEVAGAIGLLVPRTAVPAAVGLILVLFGALFTHARAGEWSALGLPLVLAACLVAVLLLLRGARQAPATPQPPPG